MKKTLKIKPKEMSVCAPKKSTYDTDFCKWVYSQANLLKKKEYSKLDLDNVIEELESLARKDKRSLKNHLKVLLQHILKNTYTPELKGNSRSWDATIFNVRKSIIDLLEDSPSLKPHLSKMLHEAYSDGRELAIIETGSSYIREDLFPEECPWTINEILSDAT